MPPYVRAIKYSSLIHPALSGKRIAKARYNNREFNFSYPGVMTATECFAALEHGADGLKFFPSFLLGTAGLSALKAVLPANAETYAVGGVGPDNFKEWINAGVTGFGIGSGIFKPGFTTDDVATRAQAIVAAYDTCKG